VRPVAPLSEREREREREKGEEGGEESASETKVVMTRSMPENIFPSFSWEIERGGRFTDMIFSVFVPFFPLLQSPNSGDFYVSFNK
jgi:hypothetical protein